jgi:Flp pilus assembly protein TadD
LINRGVTLHSLQRYEDALADYDKLLAVKPEHAGAWNNRGIALQYARRFEDALASYDKALVIAPDYAEAWNNRGIVLLLLKRPAEALASHDKALALKPDYADAWNHRGATLQRLGDFEGALASLDKALAIAPDYAGALQNLGQLLCESNRVEEGLAVLTRHAALVHKARAANANKPIPPHKARHDQEQRDYLAGGKAGAGDPSIDSLFHLADGSRVASPAVNPGNTADDIAAQWNQSRPQVVVIDDFLTQDALQKLREFCLGSTVWRQSYDNGYMGAMPQDGFACPLLAQIADELRAAFPAIFADHPLCYLWGFKYDSTLKGINVHADGAVVNVNFWITPDEANLDPQSGGLVVWDADAPPDWDFDKYNGDAEASRDFLARTGAKPMTIPYRANRAVIFDSDLFHETDRIVFQEGYENRRINITLLYGRRPQQGALPES